MSRTTAIKAILWDMDGVLVDSSRLHAKVQLDLFSAYGYVATIEEMNAQFGGKSEAAIFAEVEGKIGRLLPTDLPERIEERKKEVFSESLKPIDGVSTVLRELSYKHCVASSTLRGLVVHMLSITGLAEFFVEAIVSGDMVEKTKPAPDIFLRAAELVDAEPKTCLVIEDSASGVEAGKAAGMRVFGFIGGSHCEPDHGLRLKEAGADVVFGHMRELPGKLGVFY